MAAATKALKPINQIQGKIDRFQIYMYMVQPPPTTGHALHHLAITTSPQKIIHLSFAAQTRNVVTSNTQMVHDTFLPETHPAKHPVNNPRSKNPIR